VGGGGGEPPPREIRTTFCAKKEASPSTREKKDLKKKNYDVPEGAGRSLHPKERKKSEEFLYSLGEGLKERKEKSVSGREVEAHSKEKKYPHL